MTMRNLKLLPFVLAAIPACADMPEDDLPAHVDSGPKIKDTLSSSTNWSGYSATGAAGSFNDVQGTWTVPTVSPGTGKKGQYSSFWVGIDGDGSSTVEQIGTDSDWLNGKPYYVAWYEFYPAASKNIPAAQLSVSPGDSITGGVHYDGTQFTVTLTNNTTGQTFSTSGAVSSAKRMSAEWIAEAPSGGSVLPLANFGTVDFTNCTAAAPGTSLAPISSFATIDQINMTSKRGAVVKATTSALGADGESFSVTWDSAGP
jgi:hypothetical protein